ncbi:MAG: hypothetical protein A3I68_06640 [Candidatus Melainabacteria bacterium RIFCSPLOWO2_02_FULL_35_15]|nr:MAG: hypothetical protein A3F80_00160 [Candidatus Melainabacteria bacterium RIFCSPLOWO2_12_FULL_35_11]OGI13612.1 MAG: hypothetical protein A3I68_06640 [Candidatus Melainabacteria bacterium RIFCSPLOWO2_02_FULL_35_15]
MRKRVLNQPIDTFTLDEVVFFAKMALSNPKQLKIVTLNPEMIVNAMKNIELQAAINNANLIVPDGTGIVWAFKTLNKNDLAKIERVPGIELAEKILESANELKKRVAIFGSTRTIIEKAAAIMQNKYPDIIIVKTTDGYHGIEKDLQVAEEIADENPDLILVALGSPRQEIWINKHSDFFPKSILIGIGGSLDVWAGKIKRAPRWFRDNNLEWFYRVVSQPKRTIRILKSLPQFVWMVFKSSLQIKQDF